MFDHITLTRESVSSLCPECKNTLIEALGLATEVPAEVDVPLDDEQWEYAELDLHAAHTFLLGCNEKTQKALKLIVESGESFSIDELERQMEVKKGSLRALWGGLTKRTRTITGNPDAALIQWGDQTDTGDYIGQLTPRTRGSFKRALAD